ncbi:hypothetical protein SAMN05216456_1591 [Devosia crocina]|uniref:Uncharacterized protein n=1 Tax=Devosia crocina TaxID=429728 RepID=A0A1I7NC71_9HYPH|nr:hypothetical protein [Devosia crocina]SFV32267.1 hypothetical protein SAMN05216456_1591 [Devosia crocina]
MPTTPTASSFDALADHLANMSVPELAPMHVRSPKPQLGPQKAAVQLLAIKALLPILETLPTPAALKGKSEDEFFDLLYKGPQDAVRAIADRELQRQTMKLLNELTASWRLAWGI